MTWVKLSGIKRTTVKGRTYFYHRATGEPITIDPTVDPAGFAATKKRLDDLAAAKAPVAPPLKDGSLGALRTAYKRSPEFLTLSPDSQKAYNRSFDALKSLDDMAIVDIDQPFILATRDKIFAKRGRWLANHTVSVLSVVLGWGVPRGYGASNPAQGVPKIRRSRKKGKANPAWTWAEADAALKKATGGLRKAIALAYFGGLRKKDVVEIANDARAADAIRHEQSKNGIETTIFEDKRLTDILEERDTAKGRTIVRRQDGAPYTRDGLDSLFQRLKGDLVEEKKIRPGLTFHGLRTSLAKRAADLGFSDNDIAAALGQANTASVRPYTIEASRARAAKRVFSKLAGTKRGRRSNGNGT